MPLTADWRAQFPRAHTRPLTMTSPNASTHIPAWETCQPSSWHQRHDADFQAAREARLAELREQVAPLKARRLELQGEINRLTFESAIAPDPPRHSEQPALSLS